MLFGMKRPLLLAACALLAASASGTVAQDILIDDFNDNDAIAIWDGAAYQHVWSDPEFLYPGVASRLRTIVDTVGLSQGIGGISGGEMLVTNQYRNPDGSSGGPGLGNSLRANPAEKFEAIFTACWRNPESAAPTYDATAINYIRFTASMAAPTANAYVQPGTIFGVGLTSPGRIPLLPFESDGPFADPDGAGPLPYQIVGVPISTVPTAFVVSITDLHADEVLKAAVEAVSGPGFFDDADRTNITGILLGFRREGDYPLDPGHPSSFVPPDFTVDDILLSVKRPGVRLTIADTALDEAIAVDTLTIFAALDAMPTDTVTIAVTSANPGRAQIISPSPLNFTTANWENSQAITVRVVDDAFDNGNAYFNIDYGVTTTDLYYDQNPPASTLIAVRDNDGSPDPAPTATPVPAGFLSGDFNNSGCTEIEDFLILLDNWHTVFGGNFFDVEAFLTLLDFWQTGPSCE